MERIMELALILAAQPVQNKRALLQNSGFPGFRFSFIAPLRSASSLPAAPSNPGWGES